MGKRYVRAEGFPNIKRQTERKYSHVVIGTYTGASELAGYQNEAWAKAWTDGWNWLQSSPTGGVQREEYRRRGVRTAEQYVELQRKINCEHVELRAATAAPEGLAWCGRRDLAEKQLSTFQATGNWERLQIVPVVE